VPGGRAGISESAKIGKFSVIFCGVKIIRLLPWIAAATLAAGCSAPLPSTELPPGRSVSAALEFPELRDYRGELDVRLEGTGLDQPGIADIAKAAQLDFLVLGDLAKPGAADYGIGGFTSGILFVPGASFPVDGGRIIAINPRAPIDPATRPSELVGAIHDQEGIAIAASPANFRSAGDYALADGIEIYNQRDAWTAESSTSLYWRAIFLSTDRFLLGLAPRPEENLEIYDRMSSGARVALLAGIGAPDDMTVAGSKVGTFQQLFLFYTTHVLSPERSVDPMVEAIKRGHMYVSFDVLGYVPGFAFFARDGETRTMMGEEARITPSLKLQAELPAAADRIVLLRDGIEVSSAENASNLEYAPTQPGTYRIEAYRKDHPWILSNPVYLR
jgi:hypothetical protein